MLMLDGLMTGVAGLLMIPTSALAAEIFCALGVESPSADRPPVRRSRVAVLVPAHNEQSVIAETLSNILPQLQPRDQLVVVADNCTDDTAAIARLSGATVIERHDSQFRGKGYALDFGLRFLAIGEAPDVLVIVDADCHLSHNCIDTLAVEVEKEQKPVQARYLMHAPHSDSARMAIAEFAWLIKNHVRPLGLRRARLPCQLMGTGMAFPWKLINGARLAHAHIVEDMKLGIDLALSGYPPVFCPSAHVTSYFPTSERAISGQRKRWEHGHLSVIFAETHRLLIASLLKHDLRLLGLGVDLSIPPTTALGLALFSALVASYLLSLSASSVPLILLAISCALFAASIFVAWLRFGRTILSWKTLCRTPIYMLHKIPLYASFFVNKQHSWLKTERQ